ncbi:uncharacterized protein [Euwallacea similis]|uniref:uncharacterized protein n=1 Tax=Euwallacea similis TaxID=1736056 RepID=UPI00344FB537
MMSEVRNAVPQAGDSPAAGTDWVRAPVASAGPIDSGGDQGHSKHLDKQADEQAHGQVYEQAHGQAYEQVHEQEERRRNSETDINMVKKRKIMDTSIGKEDCDVYKTKESTEEYILTEAVDRIKKLIEELDGKIEKNTQRDIKEITKNLKKQRDILNRDIIVNWLEKHRYERAERMYYVGDVQTEEGWGKEIRDQGSQTEIEGEVLGCSEMEGINDYGDFKRVAENKWNNSAYVKTEIKIGNSLETGNNSVKVVLVKLGDKGMEKGVQAGYRIRFSELEECGEGFEVLEQTVKIKTGTGQKQKGQNVVKITLTGKEEDLWESLVELRRETEQEEWVVMHEMGEMDVERMRRMVEAVFGKTKTKTKITIYIDKNKEDKVINKKKTYALVVSRVPGEQLEKTVGRIKESVGRREEKEQIQGLRTTRDGKILVEMGKVEEDARELKEVIERSIITKVTVRGPHRKRDIIHVRGMDVTASREDVRRALLKKVEGLKE